MWPLRWKSAEMIFKESNLLNLLKMKQFTQKINRLRIPVDGRQTGWLWTSEAKELNQGLPGTNKATDYLIY